VLDGVDRLAVAPDEEAEILAVQAAAHELAVIVDAHPRVQAECLDQLLEQLGERIGSGRRGHHLLRPERFFFLRGGRGGAELRPLPAAAAAGAGHSKVEGTVRTGRHFNLVGLRWRGDAAAELSVRVHTRRGWSPWTEVPVDLDHGPDIGAPESVADGRSSDPVWAGEADAVRYSLRADGRVRGVRLEFVNTDGTATEAERRRHRSTRASARVVRPIVPAPGVPPIITREEWGASRCPPRVTPAYGEVKLAFIHHTVTANDYGPADSAAIVRGICTYHRNSNGWNDIGYNFLVDKYGQVFEGRAGGIDAPVVGAQAQGYNAQSTGIANLGTFSTTGQTAAGLGALAGLVSWKLSVHGVPPVGKVQVTSTGGSVNRYPAGAKVTFDRISGHRDGNATACPGDALYGQLPQLRQLVTGGPPLPLATITLTAKSRAIAYGSKAALTARVRGPGGTPVAGVPVQVQLLGRLGAWNTLHEIKTDSRGVATTNVRLAYNHALRARFAAAPGLGLAQSKPLAIGVRPSVSARLKPASAALVRRGTRVAVQGRVKPAKRYALLLVDRLSPNGTKRRVGRVVVRTRSGRARSSFRFARPGRYTVRFAVTPDVKNLGARSKAIEVQVK
jgi:hypothetical protein